MCCSSIATCSMRSKSRTPFVFTKTKLLCCRYTYGASSQTPAMSPAGGGISRAVSTQPRMILVRWLWKSSPSRAHRRYLHLVVAAVRRVDKQLRLVDQVSARLLVIGLARFGVCIEQVVSELPTRKWIPKFLRIVIPGAELRHDLVRIFLDIRILRQHQCARGIQHRLIRTDTGFLCLAFFKCELRIDQFPFGGCQSEIYRRNYFPGALAVAH